ncbi:hypothetical protein OXX80_007258 [Metschnikowia pulcherrima]
MSISPPNLDNSTNAVANATTNEPSADGDQNLLKKMAEIEFLPDLFALLQRVENGEIKSQDFDNHAGSIRLKLSTLRSHLQEVDGICETVEEREEKIRTLSDCNDRRVSFLNDFKNRVLTDLDAM